MPVQNAIDDPGIPELLSLDRHGTYLNRCGSDPARAVRLYAWNIAVSAALWGGFHLLEVCLRNAIHDRLTQMTGRADWWEVGIGLHVLERHKLDVAVRAAAKDKGSAILPGHVVAELTFGFWTGLLANRYHQRLWAPALEDAFPHLSTSRRDLQRSLERLRKLRNRVAHHEPVFARDLARDHALVLDVLGAIDPAARRWVEQDSRVPLLLSCRADMIAGTWPTSF